VVEEMCVTIIVKVVCIGQIVVIHIARFPRVNAHPVGHFIEPFKYIAGRSGLVGDSHRSDPQKFVECGSAQLVLDTPVHELILLHSRIKYLPIYFIIKDIEILIATIFASKVAVPVSSTMNLCPDWRLRLINTETVSVRFYIVEMILKRVYTQIAKQFMDVCK
jgi:hypothetical protein